MSTRIEHDFIGEMNISNDLYYGVQTSRAMHNFHMTGRKLQNYPFFIQAFAQVKKAAALANKEVGVLKPEIADAIASACDKIIAGEFIEQFPVDMIQGGAGTSTNMNVNEVIAISYEDVDKLKSKEFKELTKGLNLIYIYHNT